MFQHELCADVFDIPFSSISEINNEKKGVGSFCWQLTACNQLAEDLC